MEMLRVEHLAARVFLDEPAEALASAEREAAAGDESWRQWIDEYEHGRALIVRLETTLTATDGIGDPMVIDVANRGIFIEKDPHPPNVEQQVGEIVAKDFAVLARELAKRGHRVGTYLLGQMYVHVELADDVRLALADGRAGKVAASGASPDFDATLSRLERPMHGRSR